MGSEIWPWWLVFLKVSLMLDMIQIGIKGKLALIYVDQFEIFKKVGDVAYRLNLPP